MSFPVNSTSTITPAIERMLRVMQRTRAAKSIDYAGVFSCRRISGSKTWSQHAFGNGGDLFPDETDYRRAKDQCSSIANAVVWQAKHRTRANNMKKIDVAEVIDHESQRMWTPGGGWGPYGGNPGLHVHVTGAPKKTGTPPCA
jgi:hypothetical protein